MQIFWLEMVKICIWVKVLFVYNIWIRFEQAKMPHQDKKFWQKVVRWSRSINNEIQCNFEGILWKSSLTYCAALLKSSYCSFRSIAFFVCVGVLYTQGYEHEPL